MQCERLISKRAQSKPILVETKAISRPKIPVIKKIIVEIKIKIKMQSFL